MTGFLLQNCPSGLFFDIIETVIHNKIIFMKKQILLILIFSVIFVVSFGIYKLNPAKANVNGKILLQVEGKGEAWYVNPLDGRRYYLKDGNTFYRIIQDLGVGITDKDLNKIPVALDFLNLYGANDSDKDGLPDEIELALGTNRYDPDSDHDGFMDKEEIATEHNPLVHKEQFNEKMSDKDFINYAKGKILIQAQGRGEAWYVNPENGKRYYLASPAAAYEIIRALGVGAKNSVIENIEQGLVKRQKVKKVRDGDSIEMENGQIVRYIGIDSPEISYNDCFGEQAKQKNVELVENKEVVLVQDTSIIDKNGRYLAYVYVDGLFVNEYMVKNGYAYALAYYPDVKYSSEFSEHQRTAKYNRWGLWGECFK